MGRCRCDDIAPSECSCSFADSDCVEITGAGTVEDPFVATPILDPDINNILVCNTDGLSIIQGDQALNPPRVKVRKTSSQNLPDNDEGEYTLVTWDSADYDRTGWFNISVPTRLVVPADGTYDLKFYVQARAINSTENAVNWTGQVVVNDTTPIYSQILEAESSATDFILNSQIDVELEEDQWIGIRLHVELDLDEEPTASASVLVTDIVTFFSARWAAPLAA